MDFEKIRQDFPIVELMARLGCDMTHHGNMYRAPYREDIEPSMSVNVSRNLWCDFGRTNSDGSPLGGGNIELIKEIKGISTNLEAATEIVDIFNSPLEYYQQDLSAYRDKTNNHKEQSSIRVTSVQDTIVKRGLRDYLRQRCIDPSLASLWCSEIHFVVGEREIYAIGFPNNRGSWALRNSFWKGSTGQGVSFAIKDNRQIGPISDAILKHNPAAGTGRVVLFEGFMDFLSWLTLERTQSPPCDAIVLNSTVNLREAIPFLYTHDKIDCYLDNDDAGRQCLYSVRLRCPDSDVTDMAQYYPKYKDLNDYLVCETQKLVQKRSCGLKIR